MRTLENIFNITELNNTLEEYGIAKNISHLTNSQGRYISRFKNVESFRNAILEAGYGRDTQEGQGAISGDSQEAGQVSEPNFNYVDESALDKLSAKDERATFGSLGRAQQNKTAVAGQVRERAVPRREQSVDQQQRDLFERGTDPLQDQENTQPLRTESGKVYRRPIVDGFEESGYVNIIGTRISTPQDLADIYTIHRSPLIEKFHFVGLDADNKVVTGQ